MSTRLWLRWSCCDFIAMWWFASLCAEPPPVVPAPKCSKTQSALSPRLSTRGLCGSTVVLPTKTVQLRRKLPLLLSGRMWPCGDSERGYLRTGSRPKKQIASAWERIGQERRVCRGTLPGREKLRINREKVAGKGGVEWRPWKGKELGHANEGTGASLQAESWGGGWRGRKRKESRTWKTGEELQREL